MVSGALWGLGAIAGGWIVAAVTVGDFALAAKHPAPLIYTEGVMMWASREVDSGGTPYGSIGKIPSKYFCYGPVVPRVVAAVAHDGPGYVLAGRAVSGLSLIAACILCGVLCSLLGAGVGGGIAGGIFLLSGILVGRHCWSFRVDATVVALGLGGAAAAVSYIRGGGWWRLVLGVVLGMLAGGTKLTSCFWAVWIFLLCGGGGALEDLLRGRIEGVEWRKLAAIVVFPLGWLGGVVLMELSYPGSLGDQLFNQAESGINPWEYSRNIAGSAWDMGAAAWIAAMGGVVAGGGWRLVGIAGAAWILALGMLLKFGSDINYFYDAIALVSIAGAVGLSRARRQGGGWLACALALFFFLAATHPMPSNMPHRLSGSMADREILAARETAYLFRDHSGLCEDPFYPVYHGSPVLVSDPFQASLDRDFAAAARAATAVGGRIVAGDRLGRALSGALWYNFAGAKWLHTSGSGGAAVYFPSSEVSRAGKKFPRLKFQAAPGEIRFFAARGEKIDWGAVSDVYLALGEGRRARMVREDAEPGEYEVLSGGSGAGGWQR